ncbi:Hypothetical predicted protein [Paramuricea clavata]|uniref:Uncharacterized protein n=1 Tax=Paramuricea clavata TaxID=317549 RepID=A0A6S7LSF9_PARCT|nr:Hypothetical predicted protein [Paramuricea clavata]
MSFSPTPQYFGYGKVRLSCNGEGNNLTRVYWNSTDDNGNSIIFNTTSLDHYSGGLWQAKLAFKPNPVNVSYTYKCIAENKCCPTKISDPLKISYNPAFVCSESGTFGVSKELYEIITIPSKRSVKISWKYDSDPEDTGLVISGISQDKTFNITVQEYVFHDLENFVYELPQCTSIEISMGQLVLSIEHKGNNMKCLIPYGGSNLGEDDIPYQIAFLFALLKLMVIHYNTLNTKGQAH